MRLISIIENLANEYGGPANSLPNLLNSLKKELAIESVIYSISWADCERNFYVERFKIPWVNCKSSGLNKIRYSRELKKKLVNDVESDDIIFSNNLWNYPAYLAFKLSKNKAVPHIVSIRGALYPWSISQGRWRKKLAWYFFQKKALQNASLIHVTCKDEMNAVRNLGIKTPIALVPHGIDFEEHQSLVLKETALKSLNLDLGKKYVLFMSRLHKKKGLDLLLDIWVKISKKNPDWCLLIVGPDYSDYSSKISELSTKYNLTDNIKVLGMLTGQEKINAFSCSDFFVLPSYSENFGVVIGEALASGLPVVTTTGTPWSDIKVNVCGKYIELTRENLNDALLEMMKLNQSELSLMSNNAKNLIKRDYSWSKQSLKFSKAIDFLINDEPTDIVFKIDD